MTSAAKIDSTPVNKNRTTARTRKRKFSWQYSAYLIHSFVGLKLTLLLTVVLATGAIAVIAQEIDWLIYSEMRSPAQEERLNSGELLDRLQAAYPDKGLSFFATNIEHPNTSARARMTQDDGGFRYAWINPYSGEVMGDVQKFVLQSGMSLEQLSNTAGICLFSGYRRDDMEVALGAALILTGTGKRPYAELIGHHLALGYGVPNTAEKAQDWYGMAVISLESGAEPVFAPGQSGRAELIKAASAKLAGGRVQPVQASGGGVALPSFD